MATTTCGMVTNRIKGRRTVYEALTNRMWVTDIKGALSLNILVEYLGLWDLLAERVLQPDVEDSHIWKFLASGQYSEKSAYDAMFIGAIHFQSWEWIWKSWAAGKC